MIKYSVPVEGSVDLLEVCAELGKAGLTFPVTGARGEIFDVDGASQLGAELLCFYREDLPAEKVASIHSVFDSYRRSDP